MHVTNILAGTRFWEIFTYMYPRFWEIFTYMYPRFWEIFTKTTKHHIWVTEESKNGREKGER